MDAKMIEDANKFARAAKSAKDAKIEKAATAKRAAKAAGTRWAAAAGTIPVDKRALIARINRAIRDELWQLKTTRGERTRLDFGDYFVIDFKMNAVREKHVDVEEYARQLGVLKPWERMVEGRG